MNASIHRVWARVATLLLTFTTSSVLDRASAQVWSINAVGYADVDYAAGSNLVANPFHAVDNSISNLFRGVPDGTYFLPGQTGPNLAFGPTNKFSITIGWTTPGEQLVAPNGGFLWLPAATRVTYAGEVLWPQLALRSGGYRWVVMDRLPEKWPPVFCTSFTDPCPQSQPPDGTQFHQWDRIQQRYQVYTFLSLAPGFEPYAWYDENLNVVTPRLLPGEAGAFWIPDPEQPRVWVRGGGIARSEVSLAQRTAEGTNLTVQFNSEIGHRFSVLRSTNLSSGTWDVVQNGTSTTSVVSITLDTMSAAGSAFYRLHPPLEYYVQLLSASRTGSVFQCEFFAPGTGSYTLLRKPSLDAPAWTAVTTVSPSSNSVVTVRDNNAVAPTGYYVLRVDWP